MSKNVIRIVAALLAGLMILSTVAALVFARTEDVYPVELTKVDNAEFLRATDLFDFNASGLDGAASLFKAYKENETVSVIVELEDAPVLESVSLKINESLSMNASAKKLDAALLKKQEMLVSDISEKVLDGDDVKVRYNYTLAMNAVAMDVCADKLDELAMIEGVKSIYIDGECTLVEPAIENAVEFTGVSTINSFGNSNFGIGRC